MIDFNVPPYAPESMEYMRRVCEQNRKISGDGECTKAVTAWLNRLTGSNTLLTTSCSHALDMMCQLIGIVPGDEVILPSYNFVSAANAVVSRGGVCVFVDIRPDTMNMDETLLEAAITNKTKAIFVMHYAGVACEMDSILAIAQKHGLVVIEDAAQGMMAKYKEKPLGAIGALGSYSMHETKNYSMGEGGCLIVNDTAYLEKAEIIREKGTDRSKFWRGQVDKYTWQDVGSSYLPSDINAAYLLGQLDIADKINDARMAVWNMYMDALGGVAKSGRTDVPHIPEECVHNAHMFYIKLKDLKDRTEYITYMKEKGINCVFHYIPLHSAPAGKKYGRFCGEDRYTTKESERLVRLPLYYGMTDKDAECVIEHTLAYLKG
ncbi:MAG: dTDP-4-amino-4,6-dideoxygalactose transaminase [Christensenellaceae bacterium]